MYYKISTPKLAFFFLFLMVVHRLQEEYFWIKKAAAKDWILVSNNKNASPNNSLSLSSFYSIVFYIFKIWWCISGIHIEDNS